VTLKQLREAIRVNRQWAPYLSQWKHLRSGAIYVVTFHVIMEKTMEPGVVYYRQFAPPEETWCRVASEFFDGRFERSS
jgi:hypothetical protein